MSTTTRSRWGAKRVLAATGALALGTTGVVLGLSASSAQATTACSIQLYSQVSAAVQPTPVDQGVKNVSVTVTPGSVAPGAPITVVVTSSDLAFPNGPVAAAAANAEELDAVISLNGTDYVLRGSQNSQAIPADDGSQPNQPILFKAGAVTSSAPGGSSSVSNDGGASGGTDANGTTGIGATVRGAEATAVALVAPAAAGTYPIVLKAIVLNSISGTSTVAVNNQFDSIYNIKNATVTSPPASNDGPKNSFNNNVAASYIVCPAGSETLTVAEVVSTSASATDTSTGGPTDTSSASSSATDTGTPPPDVSEAPALLLIPLVGLAIFGAGYVLTRRRSQRLGSHS